MNDAFRENAAFWDRHAERDPLWAILSDPTKKDRQWNLSRFFQTGVAEVSSLLYELASRGISVNHRSALDFGCGVGRLTQALASYFDLWIHRRRGFERIVGVDLSCKMIELATTLNRFPDRVSYVANQALDLDSLGAERFDFVVSQIVLQHIAPELNLQYLRALCGILVPGGILAFQLPSHPRRTAEQSMPVPTVTPMPDEAYQVALEFNGVFEGALRPGSPITLDLTITNLSPIAWSRQEFGRMTVGNHWLDATGQRMLVRDDGRTGVPDLLPPGDRCRVPLTITLPRDQGDYLCEVDLAHEGVLWFQDKGSQVARLAFRVGPIEVSLTDQSAHTIQDAAPESDRMVEQPLFLCESDIAAAEPFPMHAVPKERVFEVLAGCGAEVIHVHDDRRCGEDWVSYQYFVRGPT